MPIMKKMITLSDYLLKGVVQWLPESVQVLNYYTILKLAEQNQWQVVEETPTLMVLGVPKKELTMRQRYLQLLPFIRRQQKAVMNSAEASASDLGIPSVALGAASGAIAQVVTMLQSDALLKSVQRTMIANIVTQSASALMAVAQFFTSGSVANRVLSGAIVASALTGLAFTIETMCRAYGHKFDTAAVIKKLDELDLEALCELAPHSYMLENMKNKAQQNQEVKEVKDQPELPKVAPTWVTWMPAALSTIVTILCVGLGVTMPKNGKFSDALKAYSNQKTLSKDVNELSKLLITDVLGYELEGDPELVQNVWNLRSEGARLLATPVPVFFMNSKLYDDLLSFPSRADTLCTVKIDKGTHKRISFMISSLKTMRTKILEVIQETSSLMHKCPRPETVGLYLCGPSAVGKSHYAHALCQDLAAKLDLNPDIYLLDKPDKDFWQPYRMQAFGIANEFMAKRAEEEPLLDHINRIVSSDEMNFEGAYLSSKSAPCRLRLAVLTSNSENPELTRKLTEAAAEAMWGRFIRVRVEDPNIVDKTAAERRDPAQKIVRAEDHSHLKFTLLETQKGTSQLKETPITINSLETMVMERMLMAEEKYLLQELPKYIQEKEMQDESVSADRAEFLRKMLIGISSAKVAGGQRVKVIEPMEQAVLNGRNGRVFIVRLDGEIGKGKSAMINDHLLPMLKTTLPFPIVDVQLSPEGEGYPMTENDSQKPAVYVLDDVIDFASAKHLIAYHKFINHIHERSIVLLATNHTPKITDDWIPYLSRFVGLSNFLGKNKVVRLDLPEGVKSYSGVIRRLGFETHVYDKKMGLEIAPFAADSLHLRMMSFSDCCHMDGHEERMSCVTARDLVMQKYVKYSSVQQGFIWLKQPMAIQNFHVEVKSNSYEGLMEVLKSPIAVANAWRRSGTNNPDPRLNITLDSYAVEQMRGRSFIQEWVIPKHLQGPREFKELVQRMIGCVIKHVPDMKIKIVIGSQCVASSANYLWSSSVNDTGTDVSTFRICDQGILYVPNNEIVDPQALAVYYLNGVVENLKVEAKHLAELRSFYEANKAKRQLALYELECERVTRVSTFGHSKVRMAWSWLMAHPLVPIIAGIVILSLMIFAGYKIYQWATSRSGFRLEREWDKLFPHIRFHRYQEQQVDKMPEPLFPEMMDRPLNKEEMLWLGIPWIESNPPCPVDQPNYHFHNWTLPFVARCEHCPDLYDHREIDEKIVLAEFNSADPEMLGLSKIWAKTAKRSYGKNQFEQFRKAAAVQGYSGEAIQGWEAAFIQHASLNGKMSPLNQAQIDKINAEQDAYKERFVQRAVKRKGALAECNMVLPGDEIPNPPSDLDKINAILKNNVVGVLAKGRCYGIAVSKNRILVPRHIAMQADHQNPLYINHNGQYYLARVLSHHAARDLAYVEVIDRKFPHMRNILNYFRTDEDEITSNGVYVRPVGDKIECFMGDLISLPNREQPQLKYEDNFHPTDGLIAFVRYRINATAYIKRGDCGLPLIISTNKGWKIAGIHVALSTAQAAYFSGISQEDFPIMEAVPGAVGDITKNSMETLYSAPHPVAYSDYGTDVWVNSLVADVLETLESDPKSFQGDLIYPNPIGFTPMCTGYSTYLMKREKLVDDNLAKQLNYQCEVKPACSSFQYIPKERLKELPINGHGNPDPLLVEIKKYTDSTHKWNPDPPSLKAAESLLVQYLDLLVDSKTLRPLRIFECLNGDGKHVYGFESTSGTGFSVKKRWNMVRKDQILQHNGQFWVFKDSPAAQFVRDNAIAKYSCIMSGEPIGMFCKDCKKVELLPKEKVDEKAKVRLFVEFDFEDNIVVKQLFGQLVGLIHEKHLVEPIKIGYNPYRDPHYYMEQACALGGKFYSTDVSGMDKHFQPEMIEIITRAICTVYSYTEETVRAIVVSMLAHYNTYNGVVYVVKGGNMSGIYTTTLYNSLALLFATFYDYVEQRRRNNNLDPPFLKEFFEEHWVAIHGDDKLQAVRDRYWRFQRQVSNFADLGITLTASKAGSTRPEFCSRYLWFDMKFGVYFGALKMSSITGLMYYFASKTDDQIVGNLVLAQFEAALQEDPEVYNKVLHDIKIIAKAFKCRDKLVVASRDDWREQLASYIRGVAKSPMITRALGCADLIVESDESVYKQSLQEFQVCTGSEELIVEEIAEETKTTPLVNQSDTVEQLLHEPAVQNMDPDTGENQQTGGVARRTPNTTTISIDALCPPDSREPGEFKGHPYSQYEHQEIDYSYHGKYGVGICELRAWDDTKIYLRSRYAVDDVVEYWIKQMRALEFIQESIRTWLEHAHRIGLAFGLDRVFIVSNHVYPSQQRRVWKGTRYFMKDGEYYVLSTALAKFDMFYIAVLAVGYELFKESLPSGEIRWYLKMPKADQNMTGGEGARRDQTPVVADNVAQGMSNSALANIPSQPNPQPSGVAPTMAPPPQQIMGALEPVIQDQDLNCFGPPNMLVTGAIRFDIKDLIYEQFLDSDVQYTFTDDKEPGEIIFQIPYDPTSDFMSKYVRSYVALHERFTGALKFRITVVGNPTFSGLVGVAWMPKKQTGTKVDISEVQKYAYNASGIELPSSAIYTLHDARQSLFWRKTDDKADIDSRPHLVVFVMLSAVSPLRTGITVRLRVASRLANGRERDTFQVSNPVVVTTPPKSIGTRLIDILSGQLTLCYPEFLNGDWFLYSDGRMWGDFYREDKYVERFTYKRSSNAVPVNNGLVSPWPSSHQLERNLQLSLSVDSSSHDSRFVMTMCQHNLDSDMVQKWNDAFWVPESVNRYGRVDALPGSIQDNTWSLIRWNEWAKIPKELRDTVRAIWVQDVLGVKPFKKQANIPVPEIGSATVNDVIKTVDVSMTATKYLVKYITTRGMMAWCLFEHQLKEPGAYQDHHIGIYDGNFPNVPIEGSAMNVPVRPELLLPAGYVAIKFSPYQPTAGAFEQQVAPTYEDDPILIRLLEQYAAGIPVTECIQFNLVDNVSQLRIGTFRYIQEHKTLVAYNPLFSQYTYMTYPGQIQALSFSNTQIIMRTNDFPATDFSGWYSRSSESYKKQRANGPNGFPVVLQKVGNLGQAVQNGAAAGSMIAGGMMGSMGSGLSAWGELMGMKELAGLNNAAAMERLMAQLGGQKDLLNISLAGQKENQAAYLENLFSGTQETNRQKLFLNMAEKGLSARTGMMGFSPQSSEIAAAGGKPGTSNMATQIEKPKPVTVGTGTPNYMMQTSPDLDTSKLEGIGTGQVGADLNLEGTQIGDLLSGKSGQKSEGKNSEQHPSAFKEMWGGMALAPQGESFV